MSDKKPPRNVISVETVVAYDSAMPITPKKSPRDSLEKFTAEPIDDSSVADSIQVDVRNLALKGGDADFVTGSKVKHISGSAKISIEAKGTVTAIRGPEPDTIKSPTPSEAPGKAVDGFLSVILSPRFYKRVVERRIADWQWEYHQAELQGHGRAVLMWICIRNLAGLLYVLLKRPVAILVWLISRFF